MDETPVTYPIWSQDHEEYIEAFKIRGYPHDYVDQYRAELESLDPDRAEDFSNWLVNRHTQEYKDAMNEYRTYPMLGTNKKD